MTIGVSKGGVPAPLTAEDLLKNDDRRLAVLVLMTLEVGARPENYAALGRLLRAGAAACPDALPLVLRRRGRR